MEKPRKCDLRLRSIHGLLKEMHAWASQTTRFILESQSVKDMTQLRFLCPQGRTSLGGMTGDTPVSQFSHHANYGDWVG